MSKNVVVYENELTDVLIEFSYIDNKVCYKLFKNNDRTHPFDLSYDDRVFYWDSYINYVSYLKEKGCVVYE